MNIAIPNLFSPNTVIQSSQVNADFAEVQNKFNTYAVQTDVAKTITVSHTYSAVQTFTGGWTAGASCIIGGGALTVTAPSVTTVATLNYTGVTNASAPALVTLQASASATPSTYVAVGGWYCDFAAGAPSVVGVFASGAIPFKILATGGIQLSNAVTIQSGALTFGAAASQIVPGATSLSHRNNANNADNLLITDAGAVTVRNGLTVSAGGAVVTGNSTITGNLNVTGSITAVTGSNSYVRRTTDLTFTTGSDSTLTFAIGATEEWEAEYKLFHTNGSAATLSATLTGPAGVTPMLFGGFDGVNANASAVVGGAQTGTGNAIVAFTMNSTMALSVIHLYVKGGGTPGNVTLSVAASAGTGTLKAGSHIRYSRIA